jgi:hypothetical protein
MMEGNGHGQLDDTMHALKSRTRREILARIWDRDLAAGEIAEPSRSPGRRFPNT